MPPRDEQDFETRRQQIIDAALQVFASKGFEKATNKDIAQAAKIKSPGLIYHYFHDKADLFRQVMQERAPVLQLLAHSDDLTDMPPRQALTLIGTAFLKTMENRRAVAMLKLILGEATRHPLVAEMLLNAGPGRGFPIMIKYFEHQMTLGTLRRMDPNVAVLSFMGPFVSYVLTREVFNMPGPKALSLDTIVENAVEVFLCGMQVPGKG